MISGFHQNCGMPKNLQKIGLTILVIINVILSSIIPIAVSSKRVDETIPIIKNHEFLYMLDKSSAILTSLLQMNKKVWVDSNERRAQKSDKLNIENNWFERDKKEDTSESRFNRNQWEAAVNTFPVMPLSGYSASDSTSVSFFHNDGTFFAFMIASLPILFSLFFLGLGSLVDLDDIPELLPFVSKYRI